MRDYTKISAWKLADDLTVTLCERTRTFPREEMYGLTSQLRRAAASIGANIAEGCGRRTDGEMCRFLQIARGSASELEYHILLARDLLFLDEEEFQKLSAHADELQRMLTGLIQSVQSSKSA